MIMERDRNIRQALHALDDLIFEVSNGFTATDWGKDNGCKTMLLHVRDEAGKLKPFLTAARALDTEARKC